MYKIEYTKRFLKDLSKLPKTLQLKAESLVFEDLPRQNPFKLGCVEKMTGYLDYYKMRIGNYRIGIEIKKEESLIICKRIAHRKEIYRVFP